MLRKSLAVQKKSDYDIPLPRELPKRRDSKSPSLGGALNAFLSPRGVPQGRDSQFPPPVGRPTHSPEGCPKGGMVNSPPPEGWQAQPDGVVPPLTPQTPGLIKNSLT